MAQFSWNTLPAPFTVLAPMEDVTDTVFRRLVASCGRPDVFVSEFTSTTGMFSVGGENVTHRLKFTEEERPLIAQIWGNEPELYYRAAQHLRALGFDGIDINMGCPVEKIIKNGCCSALIENPALARELFLAAKEGAHGLPVSIKTRIGFRTRQTEEWGSFLLELEPDALTIHGRTAKQLSKGDADWGEIGKVVRLRNEAKVKTVIIGNGDVKSFDEAMIRSEESGVDGVMIGRGVFENLFIFNKNATPLPLLSVQEKLELLFQHIDLFESYWGEEKPYRILKKFFKIYITHFPGASELRVKLIESESSKEAKEIAYQFLDSQR